MSLKNGCPKSQDIYRKTKTCMQLSLTGDESNKTCYKIYKTMFRNVIKAA